MEQPIQYFIQKPRKLKPISRVASNDALYQATSEEFTLPYKIQLEESTEIQQTSSKIEVRKNSRILKLREQQSNSVRPLEEKYRKVLKSQFASTKDLTPKNDQQYCKPRYELDIQLSAKLKPIVHLTPVHKKQETSPTNIHKSQFLYRYNINNHPQSLSPQVKQDRLDDRFQYEFSIFTQSSRRNSLQEDFVIEDQSNDGSMRTSVKVEKCHTPCPSKFRKLESRNQSLRSLDQALKSGASSFMRRSTFGFDK